MAGGQQGFFDVEDRLRELSAKGDDLERIAALVDFERFRPEPERAAPRSDGTKGGRPAFGHVLMFEVLPLRAMHALSDERCEYLIKDRLSFMRFLGLGLADPVPDANTIWTFREALTRAEMDGRPAIQVLFSAYEAALTKAGFLAMGGQIIDASIVAAPKQRNSRDENKAIKDGDPPADWKPNKRAQKDVDARWTKRHGTSFFGYKNHVNIDRRHKLVRRYAVTDAAVHDSRKLDDLLDPANTASDVWADSAYRSQSNEKWLASKMLASRIHRRKPAGKPMPQAAARANAKKSSIRARIEHVFAHQKNRFGLFIRTIGIARAEAKLTLANLAYNMDRLIFHERSAVGG